LARSTQPAQIELAFADAMQQFNAGDRDGRGVQTTGATSTNGATLHA
jgi:hypothetical protein